MCVLCGDVSTLRSYLHLYFLLLYVSVSSNLLYLTGKEYVCVVRLHDAVPSKAKLAQVSGEGASSLQEGLVMRLTI